jgi:hypothetical protein
MRIICINMIFQEFIRSDGMSNMMLVRISKYRHDAKAQFPMTKCMPNGLRRIKQS